jgi:hypothetical protein
MLASAASVYYCLTTMTYFNFLTGKFEEEPKKRKSPEAAIGRAVDKYLSSIGAYMRTIKSDGTKTKDGWRKSAQGTGISDRIGVLPTGRFIAVELKAAGKKHTLTDAQFSFLAKIIHNNGVGVVADSVADVTLALSQTREELSATLNLYKPKTEAYQGPDLPEF